MARAILHVIPSLSPGGAERQLADLAAYFKTKGRSVSVAYFGGNDFLKTELECNGIRVYCLGLTKSRSWIQAALKIHKLIGELKPDIVHAWLFDAIFCCRVASWFTKGTFKLIVSLQCPDYSPEAIQAAGWPRWKMGILRVLDQLTLSFSSEQVVPCSYYLQNESSKMIGLKPEQSTVIFNSFSRALVPSGNATIRERLGISSEMKVLLSVGRLDPQKGHRYLIEAFSLIQQPETALIIVGGGPLEGELRQLAINLRISDRVFMVGVQKNIAQWLAAADIFVFPSLFEGFGIALVEAMAAGVPVIASNTGPIPEIATSDCGILVPPANSSELAKAIQHLLGNSSKRTSYGIAGAKRANTYFSLETCLGDQWEDLYSKAIRQPMLGTLKHSKVGIGSSLSH